LRVCVANFARVVPRGLQHPTSTTVSAELGDGEFGLFVQSSTICFVCSVWALDACFTGVNLPGMQPSPGHQAGHQLVPWHTWQSEQDSGERQIIVNETCVRALCVPRSLCLDRQIKANSFACSQFQAFSIAFRIAPVPSSGSVGAQAAGIRQEIGGGTLPDGAEQGP
jgi:hypothetical protein